MKPPPLPDLPETPAELHDLLQRLFGIGSYDDVCSDQPYWKARGTEVAKLKSMLKRRRTSVEQLAMTAWWAGEQRMSIRTPFQLLPHVSTAVRVWQQRLAEIRQHERALEVGAAIDAAVDRGEHEWAERFMRVAPADADALLTEWRTR